MTVFLDDTDFYREAHAELYRTVGVLRDAGRPADAITVLDELSLRGTLESVGGQEYLAEILTAVPSAANALHYGQIVKQKSVARQLLSASAETTAEVESGSMTAEQLLDRATSRVYDLSARNGGGRTNLIHVAVARQLDRAENPPGVTGLTTGWASLDDVTSGFQPGELIILAGRPGMCKTSAAHNMIEWVSLTHGRPTLLVSLEMDEASVAQRFITMRTGVTSLKLRDPRLLTDSDKDLMRRHCPDLLTMPLYVDDSTTRTVDQVAANARRVSSLAARTHGAPLAAVVVDYLQLVSPSDEKDLRQEQVAKVSRRLKTLARDLGLPVVCLSQLNRKVEDREDRRPRMADLRESGAIENDADLVILLHRPEYYDADDQPGVAELIVAKSRNGATGTVKLLWDGPRYRLRDIPHHGGGAPDPAVF